MSKEKEIMLSARIILFIKSWLQRAAKGIIGLSEGSLQVGNTDYSVSAIILNIKNYRRNESFQVEQ